MKPLYLAALLVIGGCVDERDRIPSIRGAARLVEFCESNGGIANVEAYLQAHYVRCNWPALDKP